MALFEVPNRQLNRSSDNVVAKKSKSSNKAVKSIRGGLVGRINEIKANVEKYLGNQRDDYILITDRDVLHDYISDCIGNGYASIDTETTGLDPLQDKFVGTSILTRNQKSAYIPVNHINYITNERIDGQLSADFVVSEFQRLLDKKIDIDMFNACFDIRVLRNVGLHDIYCTWDGFLASMILNENDSYHKLKELYQKYIMDGVGDAFNFDDLFKGITFDLVPIQTAYLYAAGDTYKTTALCDYQRKYLRPDSDRQDIKDMYWVFKNIEMPCVSVVADIEDNGVEIDMEYQKNLSEKYNKILDEKIQNVNALISEYSDDIEKYRMSNPNVKLDNPINTDSPKQIAILLYDIIGVGVVDKGNPRGTGEDILAKIDKPESAKKICKAILDYRSLSKLVGTYIDKLPNCINPNDGRIHCKFNQYGAKTGRFSSSDPNLQNIPSRNHDIRKMFKATDGYVMMSADYSQQEPKVMTQMCQDPKMIQAYKKGKDLYAEIASMSFNKSYEDCLEFYLDENGNKTDKTNEEGKERRSQAKSILLGVLYGRGVPSIAEQLYGTPKNDKEKKEFTTKAQKIKDSVFKGFPAIPQFEATSLDMAYELGYVTTLWGRKRRLPDLQLPEYEFKWKDGVEPDNDLLEFDDDEPLNTEVPEKKQKYYLRKLRKAWGKEKIEIFREANDEGIWIIDNGGKIAEAERQCVNSRIQGSAADMTKLAMILIGNDERLKELGFRMLIQVHDEIIAECPQENMVECKERFSMLMSKAAENRLEIPIKCDVAVTKCWYGSEVEV